MQELIKGQRLDFKSKKKKKQKKMSGKRNIVQEGGSANNGRSTVSIRRFVLVAIALFVIFGLLIIPLSLWYRPAPVSSRQELAQIEDARMLGQVDAFAKTITEKDIAGNVALFIPVNARVDFHRLMTFLVPSPPPALFDFDVLSTWADQLGVFLGGFRTNHMTLGNYKLTYVNETHAKVHTIGRYTYALDIPGPIFLPVVDGSFSAEFWLQRYTALIIRADALPNATNVLITSGSSGVEPPGPLLLRKKRALSNLQQWNILLQQVDTLYNAGQTQAALAVCNTTQYRTLQSIFDPMGSDMSLKCNTVRQVTVVSVPLVCQNGATIDSSCLSLDSLNISVLTGIQTINAITPTPITKDFSLVGGPGFAVSGLPHGLSFANLAVQSISLSVPTGEFSLLTGTVTGTSGTLSFVTRPQMPHMVWAGPTVGPLNAAPSFRLLTEMDIPLLSLTSKMYGTLPVVNGGTGSSIPLVGNRLMFSTVGQTIEEAPALSSGQFYSVDSGGNLVAATLLGDSRISIVPLPNGNIQLFDLGAEVEWVQLGVPTDIFTITNGIVNSTGTLSFEVAVQPIGNQVWASPANGMSGIPSFRYLVVEDLPTIPLTSSTLSGILPISKGGTNSGTPLVSGRIMISQAGQIVEAPVLGPGQVISSGITVTSLVGGNRITIDSSTAGQIRFDWVDQPINLITNVTGILPISNGGTGVGSFIGNRILYASGGSISEFPALSNGQFLIGVSSGLPVAGSITAGSGISVALAPGQITVSATGACSPSEKISPTCLDISGQTCSTPIDGSCLPQAQTLTTLVVTNGTFLGTSTTCAFPLSPSCLDISNQMCPGGPVALNCIPSTGLYFESVTVGSLTILNGTQIAQVTNSSLLVAQEILLQNGQMACMGNASISSSCITWGAGQTCPLGPFDQSCIGQNLALNSASAQTFTVGTSLLCTNPNAISPSCFQIDGETCTLPVDSSCIPLRVGTLNGVAPASGTFDFSLLAGNGVGITSGVHSLTFDNLGVLSVGLQVPSDIFTLANGIVTSNGTLSFVVAPQAARTAWMGPISGGPSGPAFRAIEVSDLPPLPPGALLIGTGSGNAVTNLSAGAGIDIMEGSGYIIISNTGVLGVALSAPTALFDSPVSSVLFNGTNTLSLALSQQPARTFFAGPTMGGSSIPSFRTIQVSDMPPLGPDQFYFEGGIANFTQVAQSRLQLGIFINNTATKIMQFSTQLINQRIMTLTVALKPQNASLFLASPTDGAGEPCFRPISTFDLPPSVITNISFPNGVFMASMPQGQSVDVMFVNQLPNTFFAGPLGPSAGPPTFRPLSIADFAPLNVAQGFVLSGSSTGAVIPAQLVAGAGIILDVATDGFITIISTTNASAFGTVTSISLDVPSDLFSVTPGAITQSGTFVVTKVAQPANFVFAGPTPSFRALTFSDLPALGPNEIWYANGPRQLIAGSGISIDDSSNVVISANLSSLPPVGANLFFAGPAGGGPQSPTFRGIQLLDLPPLGNGQLYIGNAGVPAVSSLAAGQGITITNGPGTITVSANQLGTVTSVGVLAPTSIFDVFGSPITLEGNFSLTLKNQTANTFFAAPLGGAGGEPLFRQIDASDLPNGIPVSLLSASSINFIIGGNLVGTNGPIQLGSSVSFDLAPTGVVAGTYSFATVQVDLFGRIVNASSGIVNLTMPVTEFAVGPNLDVTWNSQMANTFLAGPVGGMPSAPAFRSVIVADLPNNIPNAKLQFSSINFGNSSAITGGGVSVALGDSITFDLSNTGVVPGTYTLATIIVDAQGRISYAASGIDMDTPGTVTSITISAPSVLFSVVGSPITSNGTISLVLENQSPNVIFAGPPSGMAGPPTFRSIVVADLPVGIPNANLLFDSIGLNAGVGIVGGGQVSLGQNVSISLSNTGVTPGTYALATITVDAQGRITNAAGGIGNAGTVTSVGLFLPADVFSVANSPITSAGDFVVTFQPQLANMFFASPPNGTAAPPIFRFIQVADLPLNIPNQNLQFDYVTIAAGIGLSGGGTAALGAVAPLVLNLADTGVVAGNYTLPTLSVNAQGQITTILSATSGFVSNAIVPSYMIASVFGTTLTLDFLAQNGHHVFAGPITNTSGLPHFRLLVPDDIPLLDASKITSGTLSVQRGGTGLSSLFGNQLIVSNPSGTNLQELGAMSNGQIVIGSTGGAPVLATLSATPLQTTISVGPGSITVGTVQDIGVTSDVKFNSLILAATSNQLTFGDVLTAVMNVESPMVNGTILTVPDLGTSTGYFVMSANRLIVTGAPPVSGQLLTAISANVAQWQNPFHTLPQAPNTILAGPAAGPASGSPTFRSMVIADLPNGIPNSNLLNDFVGVLAGTGLTGGSSSLTLGSSTTLALATTSVAPGTYNLATITVDAFGRITFAANGVDMDTPGTVTSVGLQLPLDVFNIVNSTVTSAGDLIATFAAQSANAFFAGPSSGGAAAPSFRTMVVADLPNSIPNSKLLNDFVGVVAGTGLSGGSASLTLGSSTTLSLAPSGVVPGIYAYASFEVDSFGRIVNASSNIDLNNPGTVTSVGLQLPPAVFSVVNATVTTAGDLIANFVAQAANLVFAGPTSGGPDEPTFRSLVEEDLPITSVTPGTYMHATVTVDQYGRITAASTGIDMTNPGTVWSVGLDLPSDVFAISNSPVVFNGTLTGTFVTQLANRFWAGPVSGPAAAPTFRTMAVADLPTGIPNANLLNSAVTIIAGTGLANGGTVSLGSSVTLSLANTAVSPGTYTFATITVDQQGRITSASSGSPGTVTSVALTAPAIFSVGGSPVTSSGTLSLAFVNQAQNTFFAGPASGTGLPVFRTIVAGDVPNLDTSKITTGIFSVARGGTGSGSFAGNRLIVSNSGGTALIALAAATNGQIPIGSTGAAPVLATITGTVNQVNVANGAGSITLSLPQNIHTLASPSFAALSLSATANQLTINTITVNVPTPAGARTYVLPDRPTGSNFLLTPNGVTIGNDPASGFALIGTSASAASWQTVVTSIGLSLPGIFSVTGSPVTSSGTIVATLASQAANTFFSAPDGAAGAPAFRTIVTADLPSGIPNANLLNSAITINTNDGLIGGATVSLGGTLTLGIGATGVTAGTYTIATITVNAQGLITSASSGSVSGVVTSVALSTASAPILSVSGSPITSSGTLSLALVTQSANTVFAGPTTGPAGVPTFRALVVADVPNLDTSKITTGILPIARGGTNSGTVLNNNRVMVSSGGAIVETLALANGNLVIGSTGGAPVVAGLTAGAGISITNGPGSITIAATGGGGGGSVTSVGLSMPGIFTVAGTPVTTAGTFSVTLVSQGNNLVWASPDSAGGAPSFRSLVVNDLPFNIPNARLLTSSVTLIAGTAISITGGSLSLGGSATISLQNSGVTAGTYTYPNSVTVNAQGQVTGISTATVSANQVLVSPDGSSGALTTRALVVNDLPNFIPLSKLQGTFNSNGLVFLNTGATQFTSVALTNGQVLVGSTGNPPQAATLTAGTGISISNGAGSITVSSTGVTSVALSAPGIFTVGGSPVTTTGTLSLTLASQTANTVFAAPNGASGTPTFRLLVAQDIPNLDTSKLTSGTLPIARGGTGLATTPSNGQLLVGNGAGFTLSTIAGTSNQINVANGAGTITLSTPQNIHTGASPTFASAILTGSTNQLILGATNTATISASAPAASRTYTIADPGANANFVMSTGGALVVTSAGTTGQVLQKTGATTADWTTLSGSGTVTSVALSLPSFITVSGSPVTTSGTLTGTLATQSANTIFAGPTSGGAAQPTFRSLVAADIPTGIAISNSQVTSITQITGFTAAAFTLMTDMTLTPSAGTYLVIFSGSILISNGSTIYRLGIFNNGVLVNHSLRRLQGSYTTAVQTQAVVVADGVNPIEIRWFRFSGSGNANAFERSLFFLRIA